MEGHWDISGTTFFMACAACSAVTVPVVTKVKVEKEECEVDDALISATEDHHCNDYKKVIVPHVQCSACSALIVIDFDPYEANFSLSAQAIPEEEEGIDA